MKVVLVTGASSGIGLACAQYLARRGLRVFGASRSAPPPGCPFEHVPMDVSDEASVAHAVGEVLARAGRLDVVVNNAGFGLAGAVEDTSPAELQRQLDTNLHGPLRVLRAALPAMRAAGGGTIVHMSSIGGRIALPFQGAYCASKFALEGLTEALRHELWPQGIRVVLIEPGDYRSRFTDNRRPVAACTPGSPYWEQYQRTLAVIEHDERRGPDPAEIARLLHAVIHDPRPRLRYVCGMPLQRWSIVLQQLLPWRVFEAVLRWIYRIRR